MERLSYGGSFTRDPLILQWCSLLVSINYVIYPILVPVKIEVNTKMQKRISWESEATDIHPLGR